MTQEEIEDIYAAGCPGEAGYISAFHVVQKGIHAEPGDLIVKD